jgi:hypothetical protein
MLESWNLALTYTMDEYRWILWSICDFGMQLAFLITISKLLFIVSSYLDICSQDSFIACSKEDWHISRDIHNFLFPCYKSLIRLLSCCMAVTIMDLSQCLKSLRFLTETNSLLLPTGWGSACVSSLLWVHVSSPFFKAGCSFYCCWALSIVCILGIRFFY